MGNTATVVDSRRGLRKDFRMPAEVDGQDGFDTRNLSDGGVGLIGPRQFKVRDRMEVRLDLEGGPQTQQCEVRWCRRVDDGRYIFGVQFLEEEKVDSSP